MQCLIGFVGGYHEEKGKENDGDAHIEPERMYVGIDFSGIEFAGQESGAGEHQPQSLPDFAVKLVDIFNVLSEVFPERLVDVEGILSATMTIHSLQLGTAILTIGVPGYSLFTYSPKTFQLDEAHHPAFSFFQSLSHPGEKSFVGFFFVCGIFHVSRNVI